MLMYTFIAKYEHMENFRKRKREEIIYIPVKCVATEKDAYMNAMDMAFNNKKHEECIVALEFLGC